MRVRVNKEGRELPSTRLNAFINKYRQYCPEPTCKIRITYNVDRCFRCATELYCLWYEVTDLDLVFGVSVDGILLPDEVRSEEKNIQQHFAAIQDAIMREKEYLDDFSCDETYGPPCPVCGLRMGLGKGNEKEYVCIDDTTRRNNHRELLLESNLLEKRLLSAEEYCHQKIDAYFQNYGTPFERGNRIADIMIKNEIRKRVTEYDTPFAISDLSNTSAIKSNPEALKQYIRHWIQLETNIISTTDRLDELLRKERRNRPYAVGAEKIPLFMAKNLYDECKLAYSDSLDRFKIIKEIPPQPIVIEMPQNPQEPREPVYGKPGFFNKKKILAENETLKQQYELSLKQYEVGVKKYKQQCLEISAKQDAMNQEQDRFYRASIQEAEKTVQKAKEAMEQAKHALDTFVPPAPESCPEIVVQHMIEAEIYAAEDMLKRTYAARNKLIAYNVVYGKYRDLVTLSTLYEYLISGRCETLEGAHGAYNLYEADLKANMIISQLSDIMDSLEKIQHNQSIIYSQITEMNQRLRSIDSTMNAALEDIHNMNGNLAELSQNSKVIAYNTANAAYYAKQNAELTDALGFMVAFT